MITCIRKGSLAAVRKVATEVVATLNARRITQKGRVHLVLQSDTSKSKKSKKS